MGQQEVAASLEVNSLMAANKAALIGRAEQIIDHVREGRLDALQTLIFAKKGLEMFSALEKNVRPYAEGKAIEKGYTAYECEIVEKNSPSKYDFTVCGDSQWDNLQAQLTKIQAEIKEREAFLKVLKEPVFIESTGEQVNPPAVTHGKLGLALSLK